MLQLFLERQQQLLDDLGAGKAQKDRASQLHRQRLEALEAVDQHLAQVASHSALFHQNRLALRQQLGTLLASQQQEAELAQLEQAHQQQLLLRQFGKVKGLEQVQKKRATEARLDGNRKEQREMEQWLSSRSRTPGRAGP
ncbi:hypothetical protein PVT67_04550 [Gallaecimonas kandeliae]|uniref:hypothetical protein n=1 Tax=Gallaecimonas kandeliae TaxID=3029055 RepID=UPI0026495145|nr:hypothetical protein [Gallaecimonas kandeliae]WKE66524.1 hypothetical protein PVT67_04550 [Gallaecimonas kandeliae]